MRKFFRLLAEYASEVWKQWQILVSGLVMTALLWLAGERFPHRFERLLALIGLPRPHFFAACITLVLSLAQFLAWKDAKAKVDEGEERLQDQVRLNGQIALAAEFDLRFGSGANCSPARRYELASAYFEKLEAEVLRGDFAHAGEVLAMKGIMLFVLKGYFAGGTGYPEWHDRLFKVIDLVSAHLRAAKVLQH